LIDPLELFIQFMHIEDHNGNKPEDFVKYFILNKLYLNVYELPLA